MVHFFALMLWAAAALAFIGGMPALGWAIIAVVIINGLFSFAQEYRAERATRALAALLPTQARVRRGGRTTRIAAEELVPGDVVLLREGDRISADARIVRTHMLAVDNSMLTGESVPVQRTQEALETLPEDASDVENMVFAGTYVASGSATAVVVATGGSTRLGGISRLTGEVRRRPTPLRHELNRAVRIIAAFAVGSGVAFFAVSLVRGTPASDGFLFAVGVIVALVPEGMLPTLSLSLAMSASRMARRGALVRHLESVETLGSTTVICTDKTGTLTENQMTARAVWTPAGSVRTSGHGYDPEGTLMSDSHPLGEEEREALRPLLRAAALCGDANVVQRDGRWRCNGDPTEGALVVLARKGGVAREEAERLAPRMREYPFESERMRMATAHALPTKGIEILAKGSPESLLSVCTTMREGSSALPLGDGDRSVILDAVDVLADDGLRVLAFARRIADEVPMTPSDAERDLEFIGLIGMEDPVRAEVPDAVARCRTAGIRVIMVTGDHPATASAVAAKAGLAEGGVLLGHDLPTEEAELAEMLADPRVAILARVAPEDKLRIAAALQFNGEVVAMTGDGVNDAPALRRADIGVAMGIVGTDVARGAADLVLLDDNFAHIVEAVEEGRAAFDNIGKFLTYHLTDNVAELAPFLVWALTAGRVPLAIGVMQVLALDIGTDLLPALALGAERAAEGTMRRPPRPRGARLLNGRILARSFGFLGPVEALISMSMLPIGAALFFGWTPGKSLPNGGTELATLSAMVFASIVMMQMANAFEGRATPESVFSIGPLRNGLLDGAVATELFALLAFVYVPVLADLLGQGPLTLEQWVPVIFAPLLFVAAEETRKLFARRHRPRGYAGRGTPA
jgi:potassium/sodium efflux P-type ATPase